MINKEATARIKINKLLEEAGWRFFDNKDGNANVSLELNVKIKQSDIDALGENFEKSRNGYVDYLLLDEYGYPFVVVEAKKEEIHPLNAKEQARNYANELKVKYVILTNGNMHYFWNLTKGNPEMITTFPSYESLKTSKALNTDTSYLVKENIDEYYVAMSQEPTLTETSAYKSGDKKILFDYCIDKGLRVLRSYQLKAIKSLQNAVNEGKNRFLFEMATGTGKTLTSAGVIKLFIRTEQAHRVLFLVDRIELENQAKKDLDRYLSKDGIRVVVFKENKQDWISAEVVISTIQSFTSNNKYQKLFKPTDFDLVISDEAHRSIGGNSRAVFEYFLGYKLGLTATPKNYLKGTENATRQKTQRDIEKRMLLDTYHTFGCTPGNPTFSYTLLDGVTDKILINPTIVDARTDITTQLLSDKGLEINADDDDIEVVVRNQEGDSKIVFKERSYEKEFFSDSTNITLCKTFMENALRDPISNEIGKSIIFCVNIEHARKIAEILNIMADKIYPNKYQSDFAMQITSNIPDSQQMTINFANNRLRGKTNFLEDYESSKSRVAVTVGMMTTGYDCPDILNLALFRPVFSPSEFIQMKGRGTRLNTFKYENREVKKETFKLFDFFAVCEYFEEKFNYDEVLKLPQITNGIKGFDGGETSIIDEVINKGIDGIVKMDITEVDEAGMKIDRQFYNSFEEKIKVDPTAQEFIKNKDAQGLEWHLKQNILDKPNEYFTVKKLQQAVGLDRRLTLKEVVAKILGFIDKFKSKGELLEDEFEDFKLLHKEELEPYADKILDIEAVFQAYILDSNVRAKMKSGDFAFLIHSPIGKNLKNISNIIIRDKHLIEYIQEYVYESDINCEKYSA
ncbi:MAG: DEAD/DEAH box helicase family protein [Bacilli bacterium]